MYCSVPPVCNSGCMCDICLLPSAHDADTLTVTVCTYKELLNDLTLSQDKEIMPIHAKKIIQCERSVGVPDMFPNLGIQILQTQCYNMCHNFQMNR